MADSKGKWFDTKTERIVTSQPEEGVQLVAPGVDEGPATKVVVEQYEAIVNGDDSSDKTITTKTGK